MICLRTGDPTPKRAFLRAGPERILFSIISLCVVLCGSITADANMPTVSISETTALPLNISGESIALDKALAAFGRCIDGKIDEVEAEQIGEVFTVRNFRPLFDANIFSNDCKGEIAARVFGRFDEDLSLKFVLFFWNDQFLDGLYMNSVSTNHALSCGLLCILNNFKRPLPSLATFKRTLNDSAHWPASRLAFLLARTLIVAGGLDKSSLEGAVDTILDKNIQLAVVKNLYVMSDPKYIGEVFSQRKENEICLSDVCVQNIANFHLSNCDTIDKFETSRKNSEDVEDIVALKYNALALNPDLFEKCLIQALSNENIQYGQAIASYDVNILNLLDEWIGLPNAYNFYRSKVFRSFRFLHEDIGELSNLDLSNLTGISDSAANYIVEQLGANRQILLKYAGKATFTSLINHTPSSARYNVILCISGYLETKKSCDARSIYFSKIEQSLRLMGAHQ
jgi:hypothetical protein